MLRSSLFGPGRVSAHASARLLALPRIGARAAEIALRIWIDGPQRTADQVDPHLRDSVREMSLTALPNAFMKEQSLEPAASGRLGEIAVPTLEMVGDLDDDSIQTISDLLAVGIVGSPKVVIPKAAGCYVEAEGISDRLDP